MKDSFYRLAFKVLFFEKAKEEVKEITAWEAITDALRDAQGIVQAEGGLDKVLEMLEDEPICKYTPMAEIEALRMTKEFLMKVRDFGGFEEAPRGFDEDIFKAKIEWLAHEIWRHHRKDEDLRWSELVVPKLWSLAEHLESMTDAGKRLMEKAGEIDSGYLEIVAKEVMEQAQYEEES